MQGIKLNTGDRERNKLVSWFITPGAYKEDTANCQSFTIRKYFCMTKTGYSSTVSGGALMKIWGVGEVWWL